MRTFFLILALACSCGAQVFEAGLHAGASRLSSRDLGSFRVDGLDRLSLADGWRIGARMTINQWTFFGHEIGYAYNRTRLRFAVDPPEEYGMAIHQSFYNFLAYATPEGTRIRPFATGGGHLSNFVPPGSSATQGGGDTKFGYNYGGGLKIRILPSIALRFDVRQYLTGKPFDLPNQTGRLSQLEVSAGVSFIM